MTGRFVPALVVLAFALALNASAASGEVRGTVRCDAPGTDAVTAMLVRWNTVTGESTIIVKTPAKPDGSFLLEEPAPETGAASSRFAVILERSGCRPVVRALGPEQKSVGAVVMPTMSVDAAATSFAVRGKVRLPNGNAGAAAVVRLMAIQFDEFSIAPFAFMLRPGGESTTSVVTDGEGGFEFYLNGVPPNPYEEGVGLHLLVKHLGYPPLMLPVEVERAESIGVTLSAQSIHFRGVVVDSTQVPVEDAEVLAASIRDDSTTVVTVRTSPTGQFEFELPPSEHNIRLAVNHQAFVPTEFAADGPEWSAGAVEIQLDRGTNVKGRLIQQANGQPVPAGHVKALASDGLFALMRTGATDKDGYYEISGISPTRMPSYVIAEADGFVAREVDWQTAAEPSEPVTLKPIALIRSVSWTLEITDPRGTRVADALVVIMESLSGPELRASRTDATGQLLLKVAPGRYVVRVSTTDYPELVETIEVKSSRRDKLELSEAAAIRGHVVWSDMTPAVGLKVKCLPARPDPDAPGSFDILPDQRETVTDDRGVFMVGRLGPGPYLLQLVAAEFVSRHVEPGAWPELVVVPLGALVDVEAVLPKASSVELVLLGAPMPETLEVTLSELNAQGDVVNDFSPVRLTVVDGRALLDSILPGRYKSEVRLDVEGTVDPQVLEVSANFTSQPIQIRAGQKVDGIVISDEGMPVAGATVSVWLDRGDRVSFGTSPEDLTLEELRTNEQGRFSTKPLRKGQYLALATMDSFAPAVVQFHIDDKHDPLPQTLTLTRGSGLEVEILNTLGEPAGEVIATLIRAEPLPGGRSFQGAQQECEPISKGCRFENISPGAYVLRVVRGDQTEEFSLSLTSLSFLRVTVGRRDR